MSTETMSRAELAKRLTAEARQGWVTLYVSHPTRRQRQILASLRRDGRRIILYIRPGLGLTIHRHAGISFPGLPRSGGTSILWGAANDRVRELGSDHRAFHLGPIGIYIGSDF